MIEVTITVGTEPESWLASITKYKDAIQLALMALGLVGGFMALAQWKNAIDQRSFKEAFDFEQAVHPIFAAEVEARTKEDDELTFRACNRLLNTIETAVTYVNRRKIDATAARDISQSSINILMSVSAWHHFTSEWVEIVGDARKYTDIRIFLLKNYRNLSQEQIDRLFPLFFPTSHEQLRTGRWAAFERRRRAIRVHRKKNFH